MQIEKILHEINEISFEGRISDDFINATAMCVAHDKELKEWLRNKETFELFSVLAENMGIESNRKIRPISTTERLSTSDYVEKFPELITLKRGAPKNGGGTWLHPDLAIQLAQWCSPFFAIQVSRWMRGYVTEISKKESTLLPAQGLKAIRDEYKIIN